jgi:hypothetical protein
MELYVKWNADGLTVEVYGEQRMVVALGKAVRATVLALGGWLVVEVLGPHAGPLLKALFGS